MVRYKRYKKRYNAGTRTIKMRFQSFMDIHTRADTMQIITISAGGKNLINRCPAQFGAYKYYKLGSVSVKLVPASTLPVDPTGLSIEAGDSTVDPRDQLTPGLMRITNGEDILENISGMSAADQHSLYNCMLLDPRWFKWMLQSGVKRYASPRFWQIGQLHQDKYPGAITNVPQFYGSDNIYGGTATIAQGEHQSADNSVTGTEVNAIGPGSSPYGFFQTGHSGRLGWLPTDGLQPVVNASNNMAQLPLLASPVEVEVMKILLPKAYKTEYWYRAFITETVFFKEPIVCGLGNFEFAPLDIFHRVYAPVPKLPSTSFPVSISDTTTGGNYGDD